MKPHMPALPPWVWIVAMAVVSGAAIIWGRRDERIVAVALVVGWRLTVLTYRGNGQVEVGILLVDTLFLAILVGVALTSRRTWPMVAASFQLLAVVGHLARAGDGSIDGWAYITTEILFSYGVLGALAVGAFNRWRERRGSPAIGHSGR